MINGQLVVINGELWHTRSPNIPFSAVALLFRRLFLRLAEGGEELLIGGGRGGRGEAFAFGEGSPVFGCMLIGKG